MKREHMTVATLFFALLLSACAQQELKAPCPDYGAHCKKTPINSWDYPGN
jgi:hypothetical protein